MIDSECCRAPCSALLYFLSNYSLAVSYRIVGTMVRIPLWVLSLSRWSTSVQPFAKSIGRYSGTVHTAVVVLSREENSRQESPRPRIHTPAEFEISNHAHCRNGKFFGGTANPARFLFLSLLGSGRHFLCELRKQLVSSGCANQIILITPVVVAWRRTK